MTGPETKALIHGLADGTLDPMAVDWKSMESQEIRDILTLVTYEIEARNEVALRDARRKAMAQPQKRALGLLLSLLSTNQQTEWRRSHCVTLQGSAGNWYRLWPRAGSVQRVEKHGTRWFWKVGYCLHDPENTLPPADTSIGHLLLLLSDEPLFLSLANKRMTGSCLWNGPWLRQLRAARIARKGLAA